MSPSVVAWFGSSRLVCALYFLIGVLEGSGRILIAACTVALKHTAFFKLISMILIMYYVLYCILAVGVRIELE